MRDFTEFDSETNQDTFTKDVPFLSDAQVLQIAQNFDSPELLRQDATEPMTQDVTTQPAEPFQLLPSYIEPVTIQPKSEVNTMLDYPYEETTYQEGYAIPEDLPPIDVVDVEPPKYITDLEEFPTVINDVDQKKDVVTLVVTSGQTGEQVKVTTTPEQLPSVVAAAVISDKAIEQEANQTANTTQTATQTATTTETTTETAAEDLLFGYDRSTVYAVGGIAAIALLIGLSYFGED